MVSNMVSIIYIYVSVLVALFFSPSMLLSNSSSDDVSAVHARDVEYDGTKIRLAGDVFIENHLGQIFCDKATLQLPSGDQSMAKGLSPENIWLQGHVKIKLPDGASLTSNEADINCIELEGLFTATPPDKVIYITYMQDGKQKIPVKTSSNAMRLKLKKVEDSSQYEVSDVKGEGSVAIEYQSPLK